MNVPPRTVHSEKHQRWHNGEENVDLYLSDGSHVRLWVDQWGVPHKQRLPHTHGGFDARKPDDVGEDLESELAARIAAWTGYNWKEAT